MVKVTEHPLLGRLIPDQFGEDLLFFRRFDELKMFWHPNSKKQLEDLEPAHRELVKNWEKQPGELPEICRNYDVLAALQSLGVYEVGFSVSEEVSSPPPSEGQIKAWEDYAANESLYCRNACDALVRYFNYLREIDPELFRDEADCPETAESIQDLVNCIRFDGMNISPKDESCAPTISFGWDVDWDMEHGLQMIFHKQEVIAMGNDLYSPKDICSPANFFVDILTETEKAALNDFSENALHDS